MLQLVYSSLGTEQLPERDLKRLLTRSRIRNAEAGLSGVLLHSSGSYLQLLEGDHRAVEATFARIASDKRHSDIKILLRTEDVNRRTFGDWAMGFINPSALTIMRQGSFAFDGVKDFSSLSPEEAKRVLLDCRAASVDNVILA